MKKFYALAIAALALSASAQNFQVSDINLNPVKTRSAVRTHQTALRPTASVKPTAAPSIADIEGLYVWEGYEMLTDQSGNEVGESTSSLNIKIVEGNNLSLEFDYGVFEATFDPATGNISVPTDQLSEITYGSQTLGVYFQNVVWPDGDESPTYSDEDLVLTYINGGYETDVDVIISMLALLDDEPDGYFHFAVDNVFTKYVEEIPEGFTNIGMYEYQDSWAINTFSVDPAEWKWMVTVAKSDADENVLRIVNPYNNIFSPLSSLNDNTSTDGAIEINVGDPDFVWCTGGINSGWSFEQAGVEDMTCWNLEGFLKYNNPNASIEALVENFEANELEISDMVDDVITVRNTIFGFKGAEYGRYSWQDNAGVSNMTDAILWLGEPQSGINNVVADNENNINAPVVYYNLQGVQVANPRGGIFIRKQGNQTSKVIIK